MGESSPPSTPVSEAHADNGALRYNTNIAPRQDPSALTTQQLLRENFWLRELLETRLNGMDKAILLLQAFADRTPTTMDIQHEVVALREVTFEKFDSIKEQFSQVALQTDKASRDVKSAVDAAFAAAKEAVGEQNKSNALSITKSEASFTKQIDEQSKRIDAVAQNSTDKIETVKATADEKIDEIRQRMTAMEARTQGITQQKTESGVATTQSTSQVGTIAAIVFGAISLIIAIGSVIVSVGNSRPAPQVVYAPPNPQAK